ncbi:MAG: 30S ribosomal protein S8 [Deltaproteobacteria bacterium]|nr:30S ribosomal protein S8 [Deltaproteobacteria bacterium]
MTDPIADLLTRMRNGLKARHEVVSVTNSRLKRVLLDVLKEKSFINDYSVNEKENKIEVRLKYVGGRKKIPAMLELKRVSRPGRRIYVSSRNLDQYVDSLGVSVLSTPLGLMTALEAQEKKAGGEVLCTIG